MADEIPTTERLAQALEAAGAPADMIRDARAGLFDDYRSPVAGNITLLVVRARAAGLADIADRAVAGEFDGTKAEGDAWAASPEGRAAFDRLLAKTPDLPTRNAIRNLMDPS